MMLLNAPFDPRATGQGERLRGPWALAAILLLGVLAAAVGFDALGGERRGLWRATASGLVHGGFLAVGWVLVAGRSTPAWPAIRSAGSVLLASVATALDSWGALCFLLPPILLAREAGRSAALRMTGLIAAGGPRHLLCGLGVGAFLGGHLLVCAALTRGHAVGVASASQYLTAVSYDVGANALSAEWLFRGALFSRLWRNWDFWPAASVSTALSVCRYVLDPALPEAIEARTGAVFYMLLLGFGSCALRAGSGSLLPGYLASISFFAAYRMLAQ